MAPAVERRGHSGRGLSDRSLSPCTNHRSPRRTSPARKEGSPGRRRSSPSRTKSPRRDSSSRRKSPVKEKDKSADWARSPKPVRGRAPIRNSSSRSPSPRSKRLKRIQDDRGSEKVRDRANEKSTREEQRKGRETKPGDKVRTVPSRSPSPPNKRRESREKDRASPSRSPSPRAKRLMRAHAERETKKVKEMEHGKNTIKEGHDKGRHMDHKEMRDTLSEGKSVKDRSDGGSGRSSRRDRSVSPAMHDRSVSPERRSHKKTHSSRSPSRASRAGAREEVSRSRASEELRDSELDSFARMKAAEESLEAREKDKQKPSFELSGKLAEETNRVRGVTLLFNEPADARKPDVRWRLYVFKGGEVLNEPLYVHRQTCYLFGRERRVADIPTDHPSCSKQHAVIQYRLVEKEQPNGLLLKQVRPYLMDLGSTNGTFINDNRIEPQRYYELFEKDTIRFGNSSREYVILHENSAT